MSRIRRYEARWWAAGHIALLLGLALTWTGVAASARAADGPDRWLSALELQSKDGGWTIEVDFGAPLVVMSHSPRQVGRLVEISLAPAAGRDRTRDVFVAEETVRPPRGSLSPLREVKLEPQGTGLALLVVSFSRRVKFDLRTASGGRSLVLRIRELAERAASPGAPAASSGADLEAILDEAHRAMTAREYPRAIALYTKALSMPGGADRADAQEYLGLARQKNGQRAHARAEYELYLMRFPDAEGAARVGQRLEALLSSAQSGRVPLRAGRQSQRALYDAYGAVSTSYQRAESFADLSGAVMLDSSQIVDLDVTGLMRGDRFDARVRGSGYYRYDYLDSETGRGSRIRYLNLDLRDRLLRLHGVLGRQSGRGGGILGRYDGLSASWSFADNAHVGGAFGFPQDSAAAGSLDTSRAFLQMQLGLDAWRDQLGGQIWLAGQRIDGLMDRVAAGYELRWVGRLGSLFSAMDYDFYYQALNLIMASGSVELLEGTSLNLLAEHRRAPFLTTRNALIGQALPSIDAMRDHFSGGTIEQLAQDRTSTSSTFAIGLDQRLGSQWQLVGDFTATTLSGTPGSGGVAAMRGTGWEYFYLAQLIGTDVLMEGDTGRARFRIFDGYRYVAYTLGASGRFPVLQSLWLTPRFDFDYRDHDELSDRVAIRPAIRAEYRFHHVTFAGDLRLEWLRSVGGEVPQPSTDAFGYLLDLTVRWDF